MNIRFTLRHLLGIVLLSSLTASCGLIEDDDLPPCAQGIDLYFRYDRNLQRANMFPDHVGGVTVYVYDEQGHFVRSQSEWNTAALKPFKADGYHMHLELPEGRYRYVVLANQRNYAETLLTPGAKQRITTPQTGDDITALRVDLDHQQDADAEGLHLVSNEAAPLDTLWHGMNARLLEVPFEKVVRDTVSLTRDTKQINVTLRDIELPSDIDVSDYDFRITDRNSAILYDNSVDESVKLLYTPFATWNTEDITSSTVSTASTSSTLADESEQPVQQPGRIAHADFMTSRILKHDDATQDALLIVTHRPSGREIIRVNLADLLSRLRTSADRYYTAQEFLDRGYDYRLTFFLQGNRWKYVNVEISTLSWARRFQAEDI